MFHALAWLEKTFKVEIVCFLAMTRNVDMSALQCTPTHAAIDKQKRSIGVTIDVF
jgi:hypothetical protein